MFPRILSSLLAISLLGLGCRQQATPVEDVPAPAAQTNPPASPSPGDNSTAPTNPPATHAAAASKTAEMEENVAQLLHSFQTAPTNTQTRILAALETLHAGQKREAILQLKMVDADTDLNPEQVQSIKNMIIAIRSQ